MRLLGLRKDEKQSSVQSLGTKNQDPPESLGEQSWLRILGPPENLKNDVFNVFWNPGTKIAPQDFLGDLGSWFQGSKQFFRA